MSFECHDCGVTIKGGRCAYELSYKFGVKAFNNKHTWCTCRYPIRADQIKEYYFHGKIDEDKDALINAFIYCQTSKGQGHVYFGTYDSCVIGNGLSASEMSSCSIFERYKYFYGK